MASTGLSAALHSLKGTLQKDLFSTADEHLVHLLHVTESKSGKQKKKNPTYLCLTVTTSEPPISRIQVVKKSEKGSGYKKKSSWLINDMKTVSGCSSNQSNAELELEFDKPVRWCVEQWMDRNTFVKVIWKICRRYRVSLPTFHHFPEDLFSESVLGGIHVGSGSTLDDRTFGADYQIISAQEEGDLTQLMEECEFSLIDAAKFSDQLSKELVGLDGANVHSIMASVDQVEELLKRVDRAIDETDHLEGKMNMYEDVLQGVKQEMEMMRDKDALIRVQENNHKSLISNLDDVTTKLNLSFKHQQALIEGDLSTPDGIEACTAAAYELQQCTNASIHPTLEHMQSVKEQRSRFRRLNNGFGKRLSHHLNNLFIHRGNTMGDTLQRNADPMTPAHKVKLKAPLQHQRDLLPYSGLVKWLKLGDLLTFNKLKELYCHSLGPLYHKEMEAFLEIIKQKSLQQRKDAPKKPATNLLNIPSDSTSSLQSFTDYSVQRSQYDKTFAHVLDELVPVILAEQTFCVRFFHLTKLEEDESGVKTVKHQVEEVRNIVTSLFDHLEKELQSLIAFSLKQDSFYCLCMLVHLSKHIGSTVHSGSFLSKSLGSCLVLVKRSFDSYVKTLIQSFEEVKVSRRSRCGIISFVHGFQDFAEQAEHIFQDSDRHIDLDKAYRQLVSALFREIRRVADEHQKTPANVVLMENFHRLSAVFSRLKITCLEVERKEAKQKYNESLQAYVNNQLGHPMEKLTVFFDGVRERIQAGVKPVEVGFQLTFSKQELRKVIKEYPAKEVKKGLDSLYKKVEKHLSEEENLLQVVWRSMQTEFIRQYKDFVAMTEQCYPDSNITMEFAIEDVLFYFSEIAQSH